MNHFLNLRIQEKWYSISVGTFICTQIIVKTILKLVKDKEKKNSISCWKNIEGKISIEYIFEF